MKAIVTVIGEDNIGIIASISTTLSNCGVNILDISQTTIDGIFTMTMFVDLAKMTMNFDELVMELETTAKKINMDVRIQKEDLFKKMYRV